MRRGTRQCAGFTLIEMLAVVALIGLLAAFVAPNLGAVRDRYLGRQALQLASQLEFARQRAVMTGVPHRLWIDVDESTYRIEWLEPELEEDLPQRPVEYDVRGNSPLQLEAPQNALLEFVPVPGRQGHWSELAGDLTFAGLETDEGWIDAGEAFIAFDEDGTTSYTEVVIEDDEGRSVVLDVLPLADSVRIRDDGI